MHNITKIANSKLGELDSRTCLGVGIGEYVTEIVYIMSIINNNINILDELNEGFGIIQETLATFKKF